MFDALIESRRSRRDRGWFGGGVTSLLVHSTVIAGAVYVTLQASEAGPAERYVGDIFLSPPEQPAPPPGGGFVSVLPSLGPIRLMVSSEIPVVIPPPTTAPFDPGRFTGVGEDSGRILRRDSVFGRTVSPTGVFAENAVEERPERVSSVQPRYPDLLRQAGIDGRVMLEFVIDTLGRTEPGSIRVLSSTNVLFEQPSREAVAASAFRPARLGGRAVRVRVQLPIEFRVSRGGLGRQ